MPETVILPLREKRGCTVKLEGIERICINVKVNKSDFAERKADSVKSDKNTDSLIKQAERIIIWTDVLRM